MATMATAVPLPGFSLDSPTVPRARSRPQYDFQAICYQAMLLCGLFLINKAGTPGAAVFFIILLWMASQSTAGAFKALMLVGLGIALNQYFVPKSMLWGPARLVITGFCAARCIADANAAKPPLRMNGYFYALMMFSAISALCSILSGYFVVIALLKLTNFFFVTTGTLLAIEIIRSRRIDLGPWCVALLATVVAFGLLSVPLGQSGNFMAYRGMKDLSGESGGFNGAFLHPNAHSAIAAPAFVYLVAATMFSTYRSRWIVGCMAAVMMVFMIYSQARTSIVAALAGFLVLLAYASPGRAIRGFQRRVNVRRGQLVAAVILAIAGLAVADFASGGIVSRRVVSFANKSKNEEKLSTEDIIASREGKIAYSWENFKKSPIYGIGFQVSTEEEFQRQATLFTAPAEKGFLYTALLEEGGLMGTTAFATFMILFFRYLIRSRNVPGLAVAVSLFLATTFEVGLFAMGGSGTFFWAFAGAAIMLGDHCWEPAPPRAIA
jgi:hypothetical protein